MVKQSCFDPTSDVCNIYASLLSENNINEGKLLIPYFLLHCHQKLSRFVALSFFDMQHSKILANFYFHEVNGRCQSKLLLLILNFAFYTCIVHRRNERQPEDDCVNICEYHSADLISSFSFTEHLAVYLPLSYKLNFGVFHKISF